MVDIFEAIENDDIRTIQSMIKDSGQSIVHVIDAGGWCPIHFACHNGQTEIVELLIRAGADINTQDEAGWTPLHEACQWDRTDIAKMLIRVGADVNVKYQDGRTPLHDVCANGNLELAQLMMDSGFDVTFTQSDHQTCLDLAIKNKKTRLLPWFEEIMIQLPLTEQKKLRAWRFRLELTKRS